MIGDFEHLFSRVLYLSGLVGLLVSLSISSAGLAYRLLGRRWMLLTGVVGVPVHELSHAVTALAMGMRVDRMRLFSPDPMSPQLGFVTVAYNPTNPVHNMGLFLVGLAPLLVGAVLLELGLRHLGLSSMPALAMDSLASGWPSDVNDIAVVMAAFVQQSWGIPASLLSVLIAWSLICIAMHAAPSMADLMMAGRGAFWLALIFWLLLAPVLIVTGWGVWFDQQTPGWLSFAAWAIAQVSVVTFLVAATLGVLIGMPRLVLRSVFSTPDRH